ncbi:MAG: hypothetical protein H7Y41_03945 [Hyphomonadaceae bacterium]|nr:hypothetical protein [Clostridia bacterium]
MHLILGLILFVGVVIMTTLVFIGYMLYKKSKQTGTLDDMLASKESDLIDIYNSLEQMMAEIEQYTTQAKQDIHVQKSQIGAWYEKLLQKEQVSQPVVMEAPIHKVLPTPIESTPVKMRESDEDQLMNSAKKHRELKGTKVRALYNKGIPIVDIAKEMSIGQGEVQLLLNIKRK